MIELLIGAGCIFLYLLTACAYYVLAEKRDWHSSTERELLSAIWPLAVIGYIIEKLVAIPLYYVIVFIVRTLRKVIK